MSVSLTSPRVVVTEVPLRGSAAAPASFTVDVKEMPPGPGAMCVVVSSVSLCTVFVAPYLVHRRVFMYVCMNVMYMLLCWRVVRASCVILL